MLSNFRFSRGVVSRGIGISALIAILFVAGCTTSGKNEVTIGPPAKLAFTAQPSSVTAGSSIAPSVAVSIEDAQGNVVTTATTQITIAIGTNPSAGTLSGTASASAVAGVATFSNLSINNVGSAYTLSATATGLTGATSSAFNVVGPPTKLAFTVQPSAVVNGSSITPGVSVSIEDAQGNVVPTATTQITIAIGTNPSAGTLSGTAQANAVAGVATFSNLSINKLGTGYTLTASATNLTGATSSAFNVTTGAPAKVAFTVQPVNTAAGVAITPGVQATIEDSQGNTVTTATNQITIAIGTNPSGGVLGGTLALAAANGVATFSTLDIIKAGTGYTLTANATGLSGATSSAFNITAGLAANLVFTGQPSNVTAGSSISPAVTVSVEDALGNVVATATNSITMAIGTNPSSGTLGGTLAVAAVNGVASFSTLNINNTGVGYTLTASATGFITAASTKFNVTAAAASKLAFTVQPSNVSAGSSITPAVTVSIEDALGNVVTSANSTITLSIGTNPSSGTLSGTTAVAAVNGVATFSTLKINNAGTGYTLAAADGAWNGTSAAFNVTVGSASKLVFRVQPTSVTAGISISPSVAVSVEDSQGNVVTTATNSITTAIGTNPSGGTLGGTLAVAAVNGVATFQNLSINNAGTGYTLSATAGGLTGATSTAFNVTVGAASKLVFTVQPSSVSAGSSIAPAVAVSIEDALGNLVTSANSTITLSIGTNPSSGTLGGTLAAAAVNGVATFSTLKINNAGTGYTLAAADGALAGTSAPFNVTVGSASKLVFTVQPTSVTAGSSISPALTVSVEDSQGNLVATATNSITMAIGTNPSSGTLGGTLAVAAVNGVATFPSLSVNNAGTGYTLSASAATLTGTTSSAFSVTAGAAAKLAFTVQPSNVLPGNSITPAVSVSVEDALGNVVTTAGNSITMAIGANPSSGTLAGTLTVAAVNGVATFPNLSINNAGVGYALTASATGFATVTSNAFSNAALGVPAELAFTIQPSNVTAGSAISPSVKVTVEDGAGNPVNTATNSITIAIGTNPSSGTLGGTMTVAAVNGVATFSTLNINNAGSGYTLTAGATGLTSATSSTFNVTAGAAKALVFSVQPATAAAGSAISPSITVKVNDSLGNLVTTATNTITMAMGTNPSGGTLGGTLSVAAVNGVATFSTLSINKAGNGYTLTANAATLTGATSTAFNVTAGAANKLAFTVQPTNVTAGNPFSPSITVSVEDSLGNLVTTAANSITMAIGTNPSSGTLGGTLTVAAVNGVASFSTLNINNTGTGYTLSASATSLTGATSTGFNVTSGAANKLAFTVQPTNVSAGSAITPAVTVSVEDSLGNVVTSANNSITVAIGTNPSSGTLGGTLTVAAVNGVASFSTLKINNAGTGYTLTAGATGFTTATSATFNVTVGTANKLAFTVQPTSVTAGSNITPSVTVSVEDAAGNLVTTATNSITMAIGTNPSSGTLGGTLTVAAVNGVATFSTLNINNVGNGYTLTANASTLTGATSAAFNVTAGAANKLAFTVQPSNITIGSTISPSVTVSVEDSLGNVVAGATNSITVAIGTNPSGGALGGTLTVAAVNGVATFSTLNINNAGNGYTLTASATGFTTVTSNSFNVTASCTNNCTLSGTVTVGGQPLGDLTLTLTGPSPSTSFTNAVTAANGSYSFTGLTGGGSYTLTAPGGYTYSPSTPDILTINSDIVQNFIATSTIASSTISGTVSYAGTKTGLLYIRVYTTGGCQGNCNSAVAGTSVSLTGTPGAYTGSYTIRGLQPVGGGSGGNASGTYNVVAEIDTLNNGSPNASNPNGSTSTPITVNAANVTVPNIPLADPTPPAPVTPSGLTAAAGSTFVLLMYNNNNSSGLTDNNGREIATSYKVYYDTNSSFTSGTFVTFAAHGAHDNNYIKSNLINGTTYYFKISTLVGSTEGTASSTASATTAAGTGTFTVSGKVTFSLPAGVPKATGPLYVGLFDQNAGKIYAQVVPAASLTSPQAYSITNVPAGTYTAFAIIDMNNNGLIEPSDISNVNNNNGGGPPSITVTSTTTNNITLTTNVSATYILTNHSQFQTNADTYSLNLGVSWGSDRPVAMTLVSGPNVPVPWDMPIDSNNSEQDPNFPNGTVPTVGDTYQFQVTLYNPSTGITSTQTIPASVTADLAFAQNLAMNSPVNSTSGTPATIPMLNWSAPSPVPTITPYTYQVNVYDSNNSNGVNWNYSGGHNGNGIPSTTTNVMFDVDGSASSSSLAPGTTYNWQVTVQDNNGNSSQFTTTYPTPGTPLPTIAPYFVSSSIPVNGTTTLVFNINNPSSSTAMSGIAFTDNMTGGLSMTGTIQFNSCSGSVIETTSTVLNYSGGSLAAGASCNFGVNVIDTAVEINNNTATNITDTGNSTGTTSSTATLTVFSGVAAPVVNAYFPTPGSITAGQTTTLNFNIYNNNGGSTTLSSIGFSDSFAGSSLLIAPGGISNNNCGGTVNATSGSNSLSVSGISLAPGGGCSISVNVTDAVAETVITAASGITSSPSGIGTTGTTATLTVVAAVAPSITSSSTANFFVGVQQNFPVTATGSPTLTLAESGALPSGVSFTDNGNGNGSLSGTPLTGSAGGYSPLITASNGISPNATQTISLTVTSLSCPLTKLGNEGLLSGTYVGLRSGFNDADGPSQAASVFVANGAGGITNGELDFGTVLNYSGGVYGTPAAPVNAAISGTGSCFQLGFDNRGIMVWNVSGTPKVFAISVRGDGALGHFIEFDDVNPSLTATGGRGAGVFQKQSISGLSGLSSVTGPFALGLAAFNNDNCQTSACTGSGDGGYQRLASVGRFTSNGAGTLSGFTFNLAQVNGSTSTQSNLDSVTATGTYTAPDSLGRGTLTMVINDARINAASITITFAYYLIDATHMVLQSTTSSANAPLFNGEAIGQSGTFTVGSLNGKAFFSMTGVDTVANSYAVLAAGQITGNGTGSSVSTLMDKISNSTTVSTGTTPITGGTFAVSSNGMGTLTIGSEVFSIAMYGTNAGFLLEGNQASPGVNVMTGLMEPQTAPGSGFGTSAASGLFVVGNVYPADTNTRNEAGSLTFTPGTNFLSGNSEQSFGPAECNGNCLMLGTTNSVAYSIDANGRITVTDTRSVFGWMRDTTHGVLLFPNHYGVTDQLDQ